MNTQLIGTKQAAVIIPSKDKEGKDINQRAIADSAHQYLVAAFGGATELPGIGSWKNDAGEIVKENVLEISSFTNKPLREIKKVLAKLGEIIKTTGNQEAVAFRITSNSSFYLGK